MLYCRNCGNQMDPSAAICVKCGTAKGNGNAFCPHCGQPTAAGAEFCMSCGVRLAQAAPSQLKSKIVAGLLGIFLGGLGIHNFYLGYTTKAVIQLVLGIISCGTISSIWGLIEGILILCGNISTDGNGNPIGE